MCHFLPIYTFLNQYVSQINQKMRLAPMEKINLQRTRTVLTGNQFIFTKYAVCELRPNKKISVFLVTGLKILGCVGTHFFSGKNIILCILKGISPFKMHKFIFFPENLKKF